jgi:hypothetical protein
MFNTAITIAGMWAGTRFLRAEASEKGQIATFFEEFDQPVARPVEGAGAGAALAKTTIAVGGLLAAAALMTPALEAKVIDFGVAAALAAIGIVMWPRAKRAA